MAHLNVPATRNAFCGLGISAQKDLQDSVISYRRHKTGTLLTVEVPPTAMKLIQQYKSMDADSPYLFPHPQWKPRKQRRIHRIPTCPAETELRPEAAGCLLQHQVQRQFLHSPTHLGYF